MNYRVCKKILIQNGFSKIVNGKSDHIKFYNNQGKHISIPCKKVVNDMMWKRLVKENNLIAN